MEFSHDTHNSKNCAHWKPRDVRPTSWKAVYYLVLHLEFAIPGSWSVEIILGVLVPWGLSLLVPPCRLGMGQCSLLIGRVARCRWLVSPHGRQERCQSSAVAKKSLHVGQPEQYDWLTSTTLERISLLQGCPRSRWSLKGDCRKIEWCSS